VLSVCCTVVVIYCFCLDANHSPFTIHYCHYYGYVHSATILLLLLVRATSTVFVVVRLASRLPLGFSIDLPDGRLPRRFPLLPRRCSRPPFLPRFPFLRGAAPLPQFLQRHPEEFLPVVEQPVGDLRPPRQVGRQLGHLVAGEPVGLLQEGLEGLLVGERDRDRQALVVLDELAVDFLGVDALHPDQIGGGRVALFPLGKDALGRPPAVAGIAVAIVVVGHKPIPQALPGERVDL